jgi:hypothetical protein
MIQDNDLPPAPPSRSWLEPRDAAITQLRYIADRLDQLLAVLAIPFPAETHLLAMQHLLPEIRQQLHTLYIAITSDDHSVQQTSCGNWHDSLTDE